MPDTITPTTRRRLELLAEYAILDAYDELRRRRGYDYGRGQRVGELNRRRRELLFNARGDEPHVDEPDLFKLLEPQELLAAFERVAVPRMRRQGHGRPEAWYTIVYRIVRAGAELLPDRATIEDQNGHELSVDTIVEVWADRKGVR